MLPYDIFARTMENPKDFKSDRLDRESFLQFASTGENNDYVMSVASRFQLHEHSQVHEYGEATVTTKNERYVAQHGSLPNPLKRYIGFYDVCAISVLQLQLETYSSDIRYRPEHEQTSHFQIELSWNGTGSAKARKNCRRRVREAISDGYFGPVISPNALDDPDLEGPISALEYLSQAQRH
jgi:hypothetical protein